MRITSATSFVFVLNISASTALALAPTTIFTDGEFNDTDWTITSIANDSGDGFVLSSQVSTGGDPNEYREVANYLVTGATQTRNSVMGLHILDSAIYDPLIQNGIGLIEFSIDYMNYSDVYGNGERYGPALLQDGQVFVGGPAAILLRTREFGTQEFVWQSVSSITFGEGEFFKVDTAIENLIDYSAHPDFSASASPMTFGFFTFNSNPPGLDEGFTSFMTVGYDNWEIRIDPIPEPATCTLALAVLCLAMKRRKLF